MKKTFQLFDRESVSYTFMDYKKGKLNNSLLEFFLEKSSLEELINKKGTTYKKLSEDKKNLLKNREAAILILIENSSMIKRPIVEFPDGELIIGLQEKDILDRIRGNLKVPGA